MSTPAGPQILVQLHGGLGNQMFQAAAGLALANRLDGGLAFDLSRFRRESLRAYALGPLPIAQAAGEAGRPGLAERLRAKAGKLVGGSGIKRPAGWRGAVHVEGSFHYDPRFASLGDDTLLAGFFQSPRYFAGAEDRVRAAFDARCALSASAAVQAQSLVEQESVAVHIRRGDYAGDAEAGRVHSVLDDAYYERALNLVRRIAPQVRIKVFSDDPAIAAQKAQAWQGEVVAGSSALEDLWLMSRCRHHIIANSSFSWWSAWLDERASGLIIAPRNWFSREKQLTTYVGDLFPDGWILL